MIACLTVAVLLWLIHVAYTSFTMQPWETFCHKCMAFMLLVNLCIAFVINNTYDFVWSFFS